MQKILIVGSGIIGAALARELALRKAGQIHVFEKEEQAGMHASGRNSGVVHSGINQKPGSLKAHMCVKGNELITAFVKKHAVPFEKCGTLVVAQNEREEQVLVQMKEWGEKCGVKKLELLSAKECAKREPTIKASKALLSPAGAVIDSRSFLRAVIADAQNYGVTFHFDSSVKRITEKGVFTPKFISGDIMVNAAGLWADIFAHQLGVGKQYSIIPFKGEYRQVSDFSLNAMVYPVPDLRYPFLGVHLTKGVDGRILAGPSASLAFGREGYVRIKKDFARQLTKQQFWKMLLSKEFRKLAVHNAKLAFFESAFLQEVHKIAPSITQQQIRPAQAGIRAQLVNKQGHLANDIVVEKKNNTLHILNAVSPGMTCSLAFAQYVADQIS